MRPTSDDMLKELRVLLRSDKEGSVVKTRIRIPVHGCNHPVDIIALRRFSVRGDQLPDRLFIGRRSGNRLRLRCKGREDNGKEKAAYCDVRLQRPLPESVLRRRPLVTQA